jgi:hypothetical protein
MIYDHLEQVTNNSVIRNQRRESTDHSQVIGLLGPYLSRVVSACSSLLFLATALNTGNHVWRRDPHGRLFVFLPL